MPNDDLIREGIDAIQEGRLVQAAAIFAGVVKADPASEQGWFWLGQCCTSREQSEYCYRRVLALNPAHAEAKRELDRLTRPAAPSGALPFEPPSTSSPSAAAPSPFILDDQEAADLNAPFTPPPAETVPPAPQAEKETSAALSAGRTEQAIAAEAASPKPGAGKRQANPVIWIMPLLLVCGLVVAFFYMDGMLANLTPASLIQRIAPAQPTLEFTSTSSGPAPAATAAQPTPTQAPSATATSSAASTPRPTLVYAPVFTAGTCAFTVPAGASVKCGSVTVPEDRTDPNSGKVQLAVAVFRSSAASPASDPLLFLPGGPGGAALDLIAGNYAAFVKPFLSERDVIVFDPRGTGHSLPVLDCADLTRTYLDDLHGQIDVSSRTMVYSNDFVSCHGGLRVSGVKLNAYTTQNSAADVHDLVAALGYQKVDLFGVSYGTRLAQVVMRDYPQIVRSTVVDSVVPIETQLFNAEPAAFQSGLQALFDSCEADPNCHAAYPNFEKDFWDLVAQLNANPIQVTAPGLSTGTLTESVDGSTLLSAVLGLLQASIVGPVPQLVYQVKSGDASALVAAQTGTTSEFNSISTGVYIQEMCHEQLLATTPEQLKADLAAFPDIGEFARLPFYGTVDDMFKACKDWEALAPAQGENAPLQSDLPTLALSGKFDPVTPPAWAQQLAGHLKDVYSFVFPASGHTPTFSDPSGCALDMAIAFVHDPSQAPDQSCLAQTAAVDFTQPYTGNPAVGLDPITLPNSGVTISAPVSWPTYGDKGQGDYWRDSSPLDIAQVLITETPQTRTQLVRTFTQKLYGNLGFNPASMPAAGTRSANGITWSLYTLDSYGRPLDLAIGKIPNSPLSLVVLLFSHPDEHAALYQSLFLPVLDSAMPVQ